MAAAMPREKKRIGFNSTHKLQFSGKPPNIVGNKMSKLNYNTS